jgi:L-2-hydroxyglutarate oxidase LhgO
VSLPPDRFAVPPREADLAVVGGGILGLAVARELLARRPGDRLAVLEAEDRLASHQTSHSSGVIHAGVYYEPGSLKARMCAEGRTALTAYCDEKGVPWQHSGKLIVASRPTELDRLDRLEQRARANGVPGIARIDGADIASIEPHARGLSALHSPETGVVDFAAVAAALASDVEADGGSIHLSAPVLETDHLPGSGLRLSTGRGSITAKQAVFCGGLQADRLARMCGLDSGPRIVPIRGGYLKLRPGREHLVLGNLYPVPDPDLPFVGAHLTRTLDGSVLIGPTAMLTPARHGYRLSSWRTRDARESLAWPGTWRLIARHPRATAREILHSVSPRALVTEAARLVPGLTRADVTRGPAGVRAQALGRDGELIEDFLVERSGSSVHVLNAPSPAATSSLALARLIADHIN